MSLDKILITGKFNVLHPGHIRLFKYAKEICPYLVIGIESQEIINDEFFVSDNDRLENIRNVNLVDKVIIFKESVIELIKKLKPKYVLKGKEHEGRYNIEEKIINNVGGKLIFSSGETFSSQDYFINKLVKNEKINLPKDYMLRNNVSSNKLSTLLKKFSNLKICVIGDLIIDEYINCEPIGMSQEDPTIVVKPLNNKKYIGGAGIVALHAQALGAYVTFISVSGEDINRTYALNSLKNKKNLNTFLYKDPTRATTHKIKYKSNSQSLFKVNNVSNNSISMDLHKKILRKLNSLKNDLDLVVFSDFNYGVLEQNLVDKIIKICNENKIFISADSQSSSQTGDIGRFKNVDLVTPTEHEIRLSIKDWRDGLAFIAQKFQKISNVDNLIITLNRDGAFIQKSIGSEYKSDNILALNPSPQDVSGAGDSLFIVSSLALATGSTLWEASLLGSIASSVIVGRIGNTPININDLRKIL